MPQSGYILTKQEIIKEIQRCGSNFAYFCNTFCRIHHPMRGLIPFQMYKYQEILAKDFNNFRFNIILKARQLGITTLVAAYVAWFVLFHRGKAVLILATKLEKSADVVKKCKTIYKYLPDFLKISKETTDNKTSLELDNGSYVKAEANTTDAGRMASLSLLIVDEAAHVNGLDNLWAAIYPTLSTGGNCILLSTPCGVGNFYHKTYIDAEIGVNDFHSTKLLWDVHPERDLAWFEKETKNMSERDIAQELLCNFNMSGETVFAPEDIEKIRNEVKDPIYKVGFDRNYYIWQQHQAGHVYLISADVARGDGKDYSVFHVIDLNTMEVIAEYQGKIPPDMFSSVLMSAGKEYGNCLIVVENNSVGFAVLEKLKEASYPNIYYSTKGTHEFIEQYEAELKSNTTVAGFSTTVKTRPIIVAKLEEYVRNKQIKIYSKRTVNEMNTFIFNNGRPEAMQGYNDDLIMSLAIACWVRDNALTVNARDVAYKKAFVESMSCTTKLFDSTIVGQNKHILPKAKEYFENNRDFLWIFKK
jgi:hypothetical protein